MPRPRRLLRLAFLPLLLCAAPLAAQPALAGPEIELAPPGGDTAADVALAGYPEGGFAAAPGRSA